MSAPSDWLVDIGHSRVKWARARDGQLLPDSAGACPVEALAELDLALQRADAARAILSAQSNPERVEAVTERLQQAGLSLHIVSTGSPGLPVQPAYAQLGCDRWLALQHPWLEQQQGFCVIDCGTAITVDLVDDAGRHRGGWIMAGLGRLQQALRARARSLPAPTDLHLDPTRPALSSADAIASGLLLQATAGIEQALKHGEAVLDRTLMPWLGGGDAPIISSQLKRPVHRDDFLVLKGLALAAESL